MIIRPYRPSPLTGRNPPPSAPFTVSFDLRIILSYFSETILNYAIILHNQKLHFFGHLRFLSRFLTIF